MLSDSDIAKAKNVTDYYEASWIGMAKAYRDYLEGKGVLTRLTSQDVKDDIPLYIETFGAIDTVKKIPLRSGYRQRTAYFIRQYQNDV